MRALRILSSYPPFLPSSNFNKIPYLQFKSYSIFAQVRIALQRKNIP